ncbi:hypothetical protein ACFPOD_11040 [Nitratireductor kimnyeongensis]|uniref:Uncharacterized protein n=1 Tax=Nitratireductor kimnyeongensis TaxID=430679 RepID=A0ABW0TAX9_9HYPH|nr:hypothetical protein [Nitratireductor kimnyeongensis]QZZ37513.1 hypothetical protein KW403_01730 [Nitratireductor kimnyeongensis]
MKTEHPRQMVLWLKLGASALLLAALTGLAFAMWLEKGAGIFLALVESGLSWCF